MGENCTPQELKEKLARKDAFLLLDVRGAKELAITQIPGCCHIVLDELPGRLAELEPWRDTEVIVMCHHGMRSAMAQDFLSKQGFTAVRNLTGGIDAYSMQADSSLARY